MYSINDVYSFNLKLRFIEYKLVGSKIFTIPNLDIKYIHNVNYSERYSIRIKKNYSIIITYGNFRSKKYSLKKLSK